MKVYITKYALTRGIEELTSEDVASMVIKENGDLVICGRSGMFPVSYSADNYALDQKFAMMQAEEKRRNKIAGLEKQIAKLKNLRFLPESEKKIERIYVFHARNGEVWGVPAEIIAENYAEYQESLGKEYSKYYDTMLEWFDEGDYEFADWAKNNMDWSDVKDQAFLMEKKASGDGLTEAWVNGEYEYVKTER